MGGPGGETFGSAGCLCDRFANPAMRPLTSFGDEKPGNAHTRGRTVHPRSNSFLRVLFAPSTLGLLPESSVVDRAHPATSHADAPNGPPTPQRKNPSLRWYAMALAMTATGTSACISVIAAWERGGQLAERLVWVGIGMVLLLSAHLLPALARSAPVAQRIPVLVLWLGAMLATGYGHATFFISAQQHAGEIRAAVVDTPMSPVMAITDSGRDLTSIAAERAQITVDLATAKMQKCTGRCTALLLRRNTLSTRLEALNVAFDESRRREQSADRLAAARDRQDMLRAEAMRDPVTVRVAQLLGTSTGNVDLAVGFAFGAMLEFVACLGWLLALQENRDGDRRVLVKSNAAVAPGNSQVGESRAQRIVSADAGLPGHTGVTTSHATVATGNGDPLPALPRDQKVTMLVPKTVSADLARLAAEVAAGRSRGTVAEIRKFFRCSQAKAMTLRRQLAEATLEQPHAA